MVPLKGPHVSTEYVKTIKKTATVGPVLLHKPNGDVQFDTDRANDESQPDTLSEVFTMQIPVHMRSMKQPGPG